MNLRFRSLDLKTSLIKKICPLVIVVIVSLYFSIVLSSCASSLQMTPQQIKEVQTTEGIVFGSILITVAKPATTNENESMLQKFQNSMKYALASYEKTKWFLTIDSYPQSFLKTLQFDSNTTFSIYAQEGEEIYFVCKMPAGEYEFNTAMKHGFNSISVDIHTYFRVISGKSAYIGKLILELPSERGLCLIIRKYIVDEQKQAEDYFKQEYGSVIINAQKGLQILY